jgi:hypothetical protein
LFNETSCFDGNKYFDKSIVTSKFYGWGMMMQRLKDILPGFLAIALVSVSVLGCVQFGETEDGYEHDDDCKFCHTPFNASSAKDLSQIYDNEASHHPVDILYPFSLKFGENFNLPNGRRGNMAFFDRNGNGKLDSDEIRLFPEKGGVEVTCASCHREHSSSLTPVEHPDDDYLRGTNRDGELCITCHRKQQTKILHR